MMRGSYVKLNIHFIKKYMKRYSTSIWSNFILIILTSIVSIIPPYIIKIIIDDGIVNKNQVLLVRYCIIVLAIYCFTAVLQYFTSYKFTIMSEYMILDIKKDIMNRVLYIPMNFFSNKDKGYIIARVNEINNLKALFSMSTFRLLVGVFEFIGASIILIKINMKLTMIIYAFIPIYYFLTKMFIKNIKNISQKTIEQSAMASGKIQETFNGIQEIKNLNKEDHEKDKVNLINEEITKLSIKQGIVVSYTTELLTFIGMAVSIIILLFSGISIIHGEITIGAYFAFSGYLPKILSPVQNLAMSSMSLQPAFLSLKRIDELFNIYTEQEEDFSKESVLSINGNLDIINLKFKYPDTEKLIFNNLTINIQKGEKVLLKGSNGSGKSTLIKLIVGFYSNYDGNILIDGKDIRSLKKSDLRSQMGIVSQDVFLFNGTIKDNVIYSVEYASKYQFQKAIELSGIKTFCDKLPLGVETNIGENGCLLSGGQKQMIAIARIIIKNPDILIFDEATANVDEENKKIISEMISHYFREKTCIFISHDNEIKYKYDKIINLDVYKKCV